MPDPCISPSNKTVIFDTDDTGRLTGEVKVSGDAYQGLQIRSGGLWARGDAPKVSSFPATAVEGDRVLIATSDPLVFLPMRYDANSGLWLADGNASLYASDSTTFANVNTTTYAGSSVAVTLPFAGTWDFAFGGEAGSPSDGVAIYLSPALDGTNPNDANAAKNFNTRIASVANQIRKSDGNGLNVAGRVVTLKRRVGSGSGQLNFHWLRATPVSGHP